MLRGEEWITFSNATPREPRRCPSLQFTLPRYGTKAWADLRRGRRKLSRAQLSPLDVKARKTQCDCRVAQRCAQQQLPMPDPAWAVSLKESESSRRDEFICCSRGGVSRQQENFSY